jgi:hypothetical protein
VIAVLCHRACPSRLLPVGNRDFLVAADSPAAVPGDRVAPGLAAHRRRSAHAGHLDFGRTTPADARPRRPTSARPMLFPFIRTSAESARSGSQNGSQRSPVSRRRQAIASFHLCS